MKKKFLSLVVIPHGKTSYRTLSFSKRTIKGAVWGSAVLALGLLAVTADYVRIRVSRRSYQALVRETGAQKDQLASYEKTVGALNQRIKDFEAYAKKINVMAGISSSEPLPEAATGRGGAESPEAQAVTGPASGQLSMPNLQTMQLKAEDVEKNLSMLANVFEEKAAGLASMPTIRPTVGWNSSPFGLRTDPYTGLQQFHGGLDITASPGNPIVAPAAGIVAKTGQDRLFGKNVMISHGNGITTFYGHMSEILVRPGQQVERWDVIGKVGSTGKSTGPHLHYEVHNNNKKVNPLNYILDDEY